MSKKKEPRYVCVSVARTSHPHKTSAEVSSSAPHLHKGLSISPIMYRCFLRVLRAVGRHCFLSKGSSLVLAAGLAPEISSEACLCVLVSPCHHFMCWLSSQHLVFFFSLCLETPKTGSAPTNWWPFPSLQAQCVSSSVIFFFSFPSYPSSLFLESPLPHARVLQLFLN